MGHKQNEKKWEATKADCSKCSALCCIALFIASPEDFPKYKRAGKPCSNIRSDYRCKIHSQLEEKKMMSCIGYDCFGAGQHVTQNIYKGKTWRDMPRETKEILAVFIAIVQLRQIRYYLTEASLLISPNPFESKIRELTEKNIQICSDTPQNILSFNFAKYRNEANAILKKVCKALQQTTHSESKQWPNDLSGKTFTGKEMSGQDLSVKLLIATDFTGCILDGTIFLAADTRDTNFCGADLRRAAFLSQGQINSAKGNQDTKISAHLYRPTTWH